MTNRARRKNNSTAAASGSSKVPSVRRTKSRDGVVDQRDGRVVLSAASVSRVRRLPHAAELPARRQIKKIAIARAYVSGRSRARTAAQYPLPTHELAVVLAERTGGGPVARITHVGAGRPFPHVAEHLERLRAIAVCRQWTQHAGTDEIAFDGNVVSHRFPFHFGRQPRAGPAREGIGFEIGRAHV